MVRRLKVNYIEQLPPVLHDVIEIKAISGAEEKLLESIWQATYQAIDNNFVNTADDNGLKRFEKILKLKVPETDTLETRRLRILARLQEQAPYTWKVLQNILDSLLGKGSYTLERNVATKTLTVKLELTIKRQFDILVETLERIVPMDMILEINLRYNMHDLLTKYTHAQLVAFTHGQLREDVI